LQLAEDSLEHASVGKRRSRLVVFASYFQRGLHIVNRLTGPLLSKIVPSSSLKVEAKKTFLGILAIAFTVPFVLGLDDFAGYVPLFNVVSVFGFGIGVFIGHMILNAALYLSPDRTSKAVQNPIVSVLGSIAFVGLAAWGLLEAGELLIGHKQ
jgi:hypothetical protein